MHTQPLTLNMSEDGVQCLAAVTPPPALSLAAEGDEDDKTQTGVLSPPAPSWTSFSSPSFPLFPSSSSSAPYPTLPSSFTSPSHPPPTRPPLCPPPPLSSTVPSTPTVCLFSLPPSLSPSPRVTPSLPSSASSTCPPPPVFFTPCALPTSSLFSPPSSSSPSVPQSLLPPHPSPPSASSSSFFLPSSPVSSPPPPAAPSFIPCSHPPPLPPSSTLPVSISPAPSSVSSLHSSSPPSVLSFYSVLTPHVSSAPLPPLLYHHYSSLVSPPLPPSVSPAIFSPLSSSCPPAPSSVSPPPVSPRPPCCPCSSLLPRLLSAHRLEVRRLLRGALASLGRRLDSLERRTKRKWRKRSSRQRGGKGEAVISPGLAAFPFSRASSCSSIYLPPVTTTSSSSDSEDLHTLLLSSNLSQSEQRRRRRSRGGEEEEREEKQKKRIRKNNREGEIIDDKEGGEEEEGDTGRFVGRMMVSLGRGGAGVKEEAPLTLSSFVHRRQRTSQSEKGVSVLRQNGYRAPPPPPPHSSSSQHALHLLQSAQSCRTCSQSGHWCFSDFTPPFSSSFKHTAFSLWLSSSCSSSSSCCSSSSSLASMLRLSALAVQTVSDSVRAGACGSPRRPLKDWTAPCSLFSDHCYMRSPVPSFSAQQQQKLRANHSSRSLHLPRRRPLQANELCSPLSTGQSAVDTESLSTNGQRVKRVSQIRIRRASPRETALTPMGLPKVKRLKKKEFSLEEIYTNKNYKSPSTNKSLETIFEEPREKDGALFLIGQQRRRRILHFPDFTQPRKRKRPQGLPVAIVPRKRAAARRHCHAGGSAVDDSDLDVMLVERLSALEDFLTQQGLDV